MHERELKEEMEEFYTYLQETVGTESIPSKNYDLVLDLMKNEDNKTQWSYYYACHDNRCLFWLERYETTYATSAVDGVESPAHLSALHVSVTFTLFSLIP